MNFKNFIITTIVGFILYWLTCGVLYGMVFPHLHPQGESNMALVAAGCFFYVLMISYIWNQWAHFTDWMSGLKAGALIGFLGAVSSACFMFCDNKVEWNMTNFIEEILVMTIGTAVLGAVIVFINGKLNSKTN